jgi:hypothetical protein
MASAGCPSGRCRDDVGHPRRTVEHRVLGVLMQVREGLLSPRSGPAEFGPQVGRERLGELAHGDLVDLLHPLPARWVEIGLVDLV